MAAASKTGASTARQAARRGYWPRLAGVALASLLIAAIVGTVGLLPARLATTLLHPVRVPLTITPAALRLPYADVTIHARGVDLAGWYVPGEGDAAVVLVHGVPGNRSQMLPYVPALYAAGYHVLLYDQRAQGDSGGDAVTYGYYEAEDLVAAATFLRERSGARAVGALGVSLGGAVVLLGAGRGAGVDAVVADSAFADLDGLIQEGAPMRLFLVDQVLLGNAVGAAWERLAPLVAWHAERESGLRTASVRPIEAIVAISPRPLLLIHGRQDTLVSYQNSVALYAGAGEPRELWLVPDGKHGTIRDQRPAEYDQRVVEFFAWALAP